MMDCPDLFPSPKLLLALEQSATVQAAGDGVTAVTDSSGLHGTEER